MKLPNLQLMMRCVHLNLPSLCKCIGGVITAVCVYPYFPGLYIKCVQVWKRTNTTAADVAVLVFVHVAGFYDDILDLHVHVPCYYWGEPHTNHSSDNTYNSTDSSFVS